MTRNRITLIRHGETDWNAQGLLMGQQDRPLNARGRRQAQAVAERLADEPIGALYSSDLVRALETARALGDRVGLEVIAHQGLREMDCGEWEGHTHEEIQARWSAQWEAFQRDPMRTAPPGGESRAQFMQRVRAAVEDILERHRHTSSLALVVHGGVVRALLSLIVSARLGLDPPHFLRGFRVDNGSISVFHLEEDGLWTVGTLNETGHLMRLDR